ncbi:MAG: response regulator [Spirochaetes bacterium]|nr:MAG: response regulator [Spirochaetota bacterium]
MADQKLVYIIDDDPDILDSINAILSAEGFRVETALSGEEGLEKLKTIKPDLILCDMMMERIDAGTKVAQEIRKTNKSIPIYLLSSIGSATAMNIEVDKLGFDGVFQKPVAPSALISTVKKALHM